MKKKAIFKFNGGLGALLCSRCFVIIKTGNEFTEDEIMGIKGKKHIPPQHCQECRKRLLSEIMKEDDELYN
jgi:NAD-dependent SIR2 family protein deacetylase